MSKYNTNLWFVDVLDNFSGLAKLVELAELVELADFLIYHPDI
jgi:hypothetical protein